MASSLEDASCFRLEQSSGGTTMVVADRWGSASAERLRRGDIDGLDLNYVKGFRDTDLGFIEDWPVRRVSLVARTVTDLSPLERLGSTLKSLSLVTDESAQLDLNKFPSMTDLGAAWSQIARSISDAAILEDLYLGTYRESDLMALRWNGSVRRLRMKDRPRLQSLDGIEHLANLEELGVFGAAALANVGALRLIDQPALTELQLESCNRIEDWTPIEACRRVRLFNASECGPIPSLRPIATMRDLRVLWMWGSTRIIDGDLTPLRELDHLMELRMMSRKTYVPTVEQVNESMGGRTDP